MIKRLWVDDIRNPPSDEYVIVRTYNDAIDRLLSDQFDEIYLDHDLADFKDGRERTGYDVVWWLCEHKQLGGYVPKYYFMLTANPVGRRNMMSLIERYLS